MRLKPLDSLRGIAAFVILLQNAVLLIPGFAHAYKAGWSPDASVETRIIAHSPVHLLWAGQEAIILLFVLSGLSLLRQAESGRSVGGFLLNRFFRIYLPYTFSLGLGAGMILLLRHIPYGSIEAPWLNPGIFNISNADLQQSLTKALLLVDSTDANIINPVITPIIYLLRLLLLYPVLIWCLERVPNFFLAATLLVSILAHVEIERHSGWTSTELSLLNTTTYLFFLTLGAWITYHVSDLRCFLGNLKRWHYWVLISVATVLLDARCEIAPKLGLWPTGFGAAIIILLALEWPAFRNGLTGPILLFLGKISFSLYLTHLLVFVALGRILARTEPPLEVILACCAAAIPIAAIFYYIIEKPSHSLSRMVGRRQDNVPGVSETEERESRAAVQHLVNPPSMVAVETTR